MVEPRVSTLFNQIWEPEICLLTDLNGIAKITAAQIMQKRVIVFHLMYHFSDGQSGFLSGFLTKY